MATLRRRTSNSTHAFEPFAQPTCNSGVAEDPRPSRRPCSVTTPLIAKEKHQWWRECPFEYLLKSLSMFTPLVQSLLQAFRTQFQVATPPHALTVSQELRVRALLREIQPYDSLNQAHEEKLEQLWQVSFGCPLPERKGKHWSSLGFQGKDPATDFRGMGVFALDNLLYFAQTYPVIYKEMLDARAEYPFSCAGINLCHMLLDLCGLNTAAVAQVDRSLPASHALSSLGAALETDENAFSELFCLAFRVLHLTWVEEKATYMDFPRVIALCRTRFSGALAVGDAMSPDSARDYLGLPKLTPVSVSSPGSVSCRKASAEANEPVHCPTGILIDI